MSQEYKKDFDGWNKNKKDINKQDARPKRFKKGEIWWVSCGVNVGTEIDGKGNLFLRPFIVLKKNDTKSAICVPLTSRISKARTYYMSILIKQKQTYVVLSQIKTIDTKRFYKKYAELGESKFKLIIQSCINYIKSSDLWSEGQGLPQL
jgi:mRNA interferase MazF